MTVCDNCFREHSGTRSECDECYGWRMYWASLSAADRVAELKAMDDHVAEWGNRGSELA